MSPKKIISISLIGMNRGSQGDSDHPFDISEYTKKYSIHWLSQVSEKEKIGSSHTAI